MQIVFGLVFNNLRPAAKDVMYRRYSGVTAMAGLSKPYGQHLPRDHPDGLLTTARRPRHARTSSYQRSNSSSIPLRARAERAWKDSSEKGEPSAVDWISIQRPSPVMTKFASTSAFESSA